MNLYYLGVILCLVLRQCYTLPVTEINQRLPETVSEKEAVKIQEPVKTVKVKKGHEESKIKLEDIKIEVPLEKDLVKEGNVDSKIEDSPALPKNEELKKIGEEKPKITVESGKTKAKVSGRQSSGDDDDDDDDGLGFDDDDDDDDDDDTQADDDDDDDDDEEGDDYFDRFFDDILGEDDDDDDDDDDVSPSTGSQAVVAQPEESVIELNPQDELDAAEEAAGESDVPSDGTVVEQTNDNDYVVNKDPIDNEPDAVQHSVQLVPVPQNNVHHVEVVKPVPANDDDDDDDDDDDEDDDGLDALTDEVEDDDDDDDDDEDTADDDDDDDDEEDGIEDVLETKRSRESKSHKVPHSKKPKACKKKHHRHLARNKSVNKVR